MYLKGQLTYGNLPKTSMILYWKHSRVCRLEACIQEFDTIYASDEAPTAVPWNIMAVTKELLLAVTSNDITPLSLFQLDPEKSQS